jgi:hypothetical protein
MTPYSLRSIEKSLAPNGDKQRHIVDGTGKLQTRIK